MARINMDDDIEARPEFWRLLPLVNADREKALGKLVLFFRLAQRRYVEGIPISRTELDSSDLGCMIDSGWAVPEQDGFRAKGADRQFAWLIQRHEAGRKGGRPPKKKEPDETGRKPGETDRLAGETGSNPLPLSSSLAQKNNTSLPERPAFDFESLYKQYPRLVGKKKGLEKCRRQIRTVADFGRLSVAIHRYRAQVERDGTEKRFIKHFDTFMGCWEDYLDTDPEPTLVEKDYTFEGAFNVP